jgi:hypothetical protein
MSEVVDQIIPDFDTSVYQGLIIKYPENGERQAKAAEFNQNMKYVIDRMRLLMTSVIEQMQENQRVFNEQITVLQDVVKNAPEAYSTLQKIGAEMLKDDNTETAILNAINTKADSDKMQEGLAQIQTAFNDLIAEIDKLGAQ